MQEFVGCWDIWGRKHLAEQFPPTVLSCPSPVYWCLCELSEELGNEQEKKTQPCNTSVALSGRSPRHLISSSPAQAPNSARTFLKAGLSPAELCKLLNAVQNKERFVRTIISLSGKEKKLKFLAFSLLVSQMSHWVWHFTLQQRSIITVTVVPSSNSITSYCTLLNANEQVFGKKK